MNNNRKMYSILEKNSLSHMNDLLILILNNQLYKNAGIVIMACGHINHGCHVSFTEVTYLIVLLLLLLLSRFSRV